MNATRTAPESARLVMTLPDGLAWCPVDARRGEIVCWPDWQEAPTEPLDSAAARPILSMMGAVVAGARRAIR